MKLKQLLEQLKCWHQWQTIERETIEGKYSEQAGSQHLTHSEFFTIKRKCVCEKCAKIKIFKL